jgi:hypothetical protein
MIDPNRRYTTEEIERLWALLCSRPASQMVALNLGIANFEILIRAIETIAWEE